MPERLFMHQRAPLQAALATMLAAIAATWHSFALAESGVPCAYGDFIFCPVLLADRALRARTTTAALSLARCVAGFNWACRLSGLAREDVRSGLARIAGLPATLALATPGFLAIPAPCRRRPVTLRP